MEMWGVPGEEADIAVTSEMIAAGRDAMARDYEVDCEAREELEAAASDISKLYGSLSDFAEENEKLRAELAVLRMAIADGTPEYHGPVKDGKAVPDVVHERMHEAVKDVLAGRVMQDARRQMQEALKNAPREKAPFPMGKSMVIGLRLP
jgi:regulator of replication initiation timing